MKFSKTGIDGLVLIEPAVFKDQRGCFFEAYNKAEFKANGIDVEFVQDNVSVSQKNVLRGLHFQNPPFAQGKLVSVLRGAVLDVAVDIRKNSATYGQHYLVELSAENRTILYIPPGFAHGFVALEDETIFSYKCTNNYNKASEGGIMWNDPTLNIQWNVHQPVLSEKDLVFGPFSTFESAF